MKRSHLRLQEQSDACLTSDALSYQGVKDAPPNAAECLKFVLSRIPAMVHSIDQDGRIVNVSDRWLEVLRYPRDEVIGKRSVEFLTDESRRYAEAVTLPQFWMTGSASDISYQFVRKDGKVVDILMSAIAEYDEAGVPLRSVAVLTEAPDNETTAGPQRNRNGHGLTRRELTILNLIADGRSDKEIASELGVSPLTIHKHVSHILLRMQAQSRTEAATRALRERLIN